MLKKVPIFNGYLKMESSFLKFYEAELNYWLCLTKISKGQVTFLFAYTFILLWIIQ